MTHDPKEYAPKSLGDLSDKFKPTYSRDDLTWTFAGTCPECGGSVSRIYAVTALTAAADDGIAVDGEKLAADGLRTMVCDCGLSHARRPDDDTGCGAYWKVKL
jgi:hypothetical protein